MAPDIFAIETFTFRFKFFWKFIQHTDKAPGCAVGIRLLVEAQIFPFTTALRSQTGKCPTV
jgi:hypothetical protein